MIKYISLATAAILVAIDQFTKYLVVKYLNLGESLNLISFGNREWLNFTYQKNTGAAFSILQDRRLFLIILTSIILLGVIIMILTNRIKNKAYIWAFSLIVAGGAGNLTDRIVNGYVVDFIDVRIINFAVFNFADICAVIGTASLIILYIINESKEKKIRITNDEEKTEIRSESGLAEKSAVASDISEQDSSKIKSDE